MNKTPPKYPLRLLRLFCKPEYLEEIEGDLLERYEKQPSSWLLTQEVLKLLRSRIIKNFEGTKKLNCFGMLKNYFKITWRSLFRQKLYSAINIGGLAIGITVFLLISIYVQYEKSYDTHFENADNIHNIYLRQKTNMSNGTDLYAVTPAALPVELMNQYPEVDHATSLSLRNTLLEIKNESYLEDVLFADEFYLNVFQHPFIAGNSQTALENEKGAVITESLAEKLFGKTEVIGEKIIFWGGREAFITGVIEDIPSNSTLRFSCILSLQASTYYLQERTKSIWNGNEYYTFLTLQENSSLPNFEEKLQETVEEHWPHKNIPTTYLVSGLEDIHLRNNVNADIGTKGNKRQLNLFSAIAIIVLILACVNYVNLAIARSVKRASEVGLRKAIGADKRQLISQFLIESVTLSVFSLLLSIVLILFLLPIFGSMIERDLSFQLIHELNLIPMILGLVVLIGLVSGSYPALFMSSLKPAEVIKGKLSIKGSGNGLQKGLVIAQYVISIVMISVSLIVYFQMRFIDQKDLGFQKEQILTYDMRSNKTIASIEILREDFYSNPLTEEVTFSSDLPANIGSSTFLKNDGTGGSIYRLNVDENFLNVYELELLAGRFLSDERDGGEMKNYVLNESAANAFGWTAESAIGEVFVNDNEAKLVVGVVKDFHMQSMHLPIAPLMIGVKKYKRYISIKTYPENIPQTLEFMEETIGEFSSYPFHFRFLDDYFNELYKEDLRQGQIFGFFTLIALLIASLGLFGLAAFNIGQRTKEIGIRKVLGASISQIVLNFSKSFLLLVVVAFIIAVPFSWYLSNVWLENFIYRIEPTWWMFLIAGIGAMLLAFITISSQSIKASFVNPVESLKDE